MTDIDAATRAIDAALPEMARSVIRSHLDVTVPENEAFLRAPDEREHHQTEWHQWGIISHTRVFLHDFDVVVPRYLHDWHLFDEVMQVLESTIDGMPRRQLLRIAILLHDLGKFGARTRGRSRFHFSGHEVLSGDIVRRDLNLGRYGLTDPQIEYIALTAEDHFVLGSARRVARERGQYNAAFIEGAQFTDLARSIKAKHPDDYVEIGVLFLGDSLAKAHPPDGPARALEQYDLNILVARRYLEIVVGEGIC